MSLAPTVMTSAVLLAATIGGCATAPSEVPVARVHVPTLERLCIDREGEASFSTTARGNTRTCYLMPPAQDDGRGYDLVRPEESVWSRVTSSAGGDSGRHQAFGHFDRRSTGSVRWVLGDDGRIVEAQLQGALGLSWRWDPAEGRLERLELAWPDHQVTVNGRAQTATRVQVGVGGAHYWESTVMTRPDAGGRALEAWLSDGRLDVSSPNGNGNFAAFPICPLGEREVWDDFNGSFPRVMRCLRGDAEWLRIERDDRGRVVTIAERRLGGTKPAYERSLRLTWHEHGLVPERVWVEVDARKEGLEVVFSATGEPVLTRHHERGQLEGLAVHWRRARAREVRLYSGGVAQELDLVTRWSEGRRSIKLPELRFGLEDQVPGKEPGEDQSTGFVWPE